MALWTRGVLCGQSDTLRCTQQLRAFCSFILHQQKSKMLPGLQPPPERLSSTRHYSSRGEGKTRDDLPLHRRKTSYYDILKVTPNATQSEIKTAYYEQALIYHPDKNPDKVDAAQAFSEIGEAYAVLSNISLRRKYDRGILNEYDVRGKPSSKDDASKPRGPAQHQYQGAWQRARPFSEYTQPDGKPIYDFEAFYKAHYGNQMLREHYFRAMKQYYKEMEVKHSKERKTKSFVDTFVIVLFASAAFFLFKS